MMRTSVLTINRVGEIVTLGLANGRIFIYRLPQKIKRI